MNIRNVLSTYKKLRDLTDDETALLETLCAMTDTERELTVEALQPQKVAKKAGKKASKSTRTSSLGTTIKSNLEQRRQLDSGVSKMRCAATVDDNGGEMPCGEYADANVHHLGTVTGYHEFQPAQPEKAISA